jgi:hypothetical protein
VVITADDSTDSRYCEMFGFIDIFVTGRFQPDTGLAGQFAAR